MADLPEIVQFGALEASLQQVTERIAHHLELWSLQFRVTEQARNDWPTFFEAKGNLFDMAQARIFVFEPHANRTVFVCNLSDGWHSLFWNLAERDSVNGAFFRATIDPDVKYGVHGMEFWRNGRSIRHIRALQEERGWEFLNEGEPLPFERTVDLTKRRITDRFNITHVKLYCRDFGIEFSDAYSYPGKGTLISRTKS